MARLSAWPRVRNWFRAQAHFDLLFLLLEKSRAPLAELRRLGRQVASRRRSAFLPTVEGLEPRLVPTIVQFAPGPISSQPNVYPVELGSDQANLTVVLDAPSDSAVTVDYNTSDGSASAGTDYTGVSGQLTFRPGYTQETIAVPLIYQYGDCGSSFWVWLSNPSSNAGLANPDSAQVVIEPSVGFYNTTFQVQYSDDAANLEVDLSAPTSQDVQVSYTTGDLSALSGTDYLRTVGVLTIPAGNTTGTISVPLLDQPEADDRTFALSLTSPVNAVFGTLTSDSLSSSTVIIIEPPPSVQFHAQAQQLLYSRTQQVEVDLSYPSDQPISVDYSMSDGTDSTTAAHAGTDYTSSSGTLYFAAGVTTATVTVNTLTPSQEEGGRDFSLTLSDPTNATLGSLVTETLTLVPQIQLRTVTQQLAYGVQSTTEVDLSCPSLLPVSVSYGTKNGSALAGTDYVATGGVLFFNKGSTFGPGYTSQTIQINTLTPTETDSKSFSLLLGSPGNAFLATTTEVLTVGAPSPTYKLPPHLQVNIGDGDYDSAPFNATAAITGLLVGDTPGANLEGVTPQISYFDHSGHDITNIDSNGDREGPTDVGTYTVTASFSGSADYASVSASATFTIHQAVPVLTLSDDGGTADGTTTFPASFALFDAAGTAVITSGNPAATLEGAQLTVTYEDSSGRSLSAAPSAAGNYTVLASFPGTADYAPVLSRADFNIRPASSSTLKATTVQISASGGVYNGNAFTATATVTPAGGGPQQTLGGASLTITYYTSDNVASLNAPSDAGTYLVIASFTGSTGYADSEASTSFTIVPAKPTIQISNQSFDYDGQPHGATAEAFGVGNQDLRAANVTYSGGSTPVNPGTYWANASFDPSTLSAPLNKDYTSATATAMITIGLKTTSAPQSGQSSSSYQPGTSAWSALTRFATVDPASWAAPVGTNVTFPVLSSDQGLYPDNPVNPGDTTITFATWPVGAGERITPYEVAPIDSGLAPLNTALAQVWGGSGGLSLFGTFSPPPLLLSLTGTLVSAPQGGQYILPGQGGLTAPTGGLAALAGNAQGLTDLETYTGAPPLIIGPDWNYQTPFNSLNLPGYGGNLNSFVQGTRFSNENVGQLVEVDDQGAVKVYEGQGDTGDIPLSATSADGTTIATISESWWEKWTEADSTNYTGTIHGYHDGTSSFSITVRHYDSSGNLLWQRTQAQNVSVFSDSYDDYYGGVEDAHGDEQSGTLTNSDDWTIFLNQPDDGNGVKQITQVQGANTSDVNWSSSLYLLYDSGQQYYKDATNIFSLGQSHSLSANGNATLNDAAGDQGRETFTYQESAGNGLTCDQETVQIGQGSDMQTLTTLGYQEKPTQSASWSDSGNESKPGDLAAGQDSPLIDSFASSAAFQERYLVQVNGGTWNAQANNADLGITVAGAGTASQSSSDNGWGNFSGVNVALADGSEGVLGGTELFDRRQSTHLSTQDNLQLSTDDAGTLSLDSLLATQNYADTSDNGDQGTVTAQDESGTDTDVYSDAFTTDFSTSQNVGVTLTAEENDSGTGLDVSLGVGANGTLGQVQSDNGSDQFQGLAGLGPTQLSLGSGGGVAAQRFASVVSSPTMTETDNGSDTFQDFQQTITTYNASENLESQNQPQGGLITGPWTIDSFGGFVQPQRSYTDTLAGSAQVKDATVPTTTPANTESDTENDSAGVNFTIQASGTDTRQDLFAGLGAGATLTITENVSDNSTPVLGGNETDTSLVENPLLGWNPAVSANPTQPAASNSLLSQLAAAKTTLSGNFNDRLGTSESGTLGLNFTNDGSKWGCTNLSLTVNGSNTFNLGGSGLDQIVAGANDAAVSGSSAPEDLSGNYRASDIGSGTSTQNVTSTYTPATASSAASLALALRVTGGESDNGSQTQTGTADFDLTVDGNNPLMGTPPGGNGAGIADAKDTITDEANLNDNLGAGETFTLSGATYQVDNNNWKLLTLGASLTGNDNFNDSATGDSEDDEDYNNPSESTKPDNNKSIGDFETSDNGNATESFTLTKMSTDSSVTFSGTVNGQDSDQEEEDGTDDYEDYPNTGDPLASTLDGPGGPTGLGQSLSSGDDQYKRNMNGGEKFGLSFGATVDDSGKVTPTSFSGNVQAQEQDTEQDDGTEEDDGSSGTPNSSGVITGNGNSVGDHYKDQAKGSDNTNLQLTGTPDANAPGGLDFSAYLSDNSSDNYVDALTGADKVNTGTGTSAAVADADSLQLGDKGTDSGFVHANYTSDSTGAWTLNGWNAKLTSRQNVNGNDQGNDETGTGSSATGQGYTDSGSETVVDQETLVGNGYSATEVDQETLQDSYDDSTTPSGTTPKPDEDTGSDNYVLSQTLTLGTDGSVTVDSATLSDTSVLSDVDLGNGSFTISASTGTGGGTHVTENGAVKPLPGGFNIAFDGSADWLTNYVDTVSGDIETALADPTSGSGPTFTSSYTSTGTGSELVESSAASTRSVFYNRAGQVLSDETQDASGNILQYNVYVYDAAGHKISQTLGEGTPQQATTTYTYVAPGSNGAGHLASVTDPNGNTTSYTYNAQGQVVGMTDQLGHTQTESYNPLGQLISVTNRDGLRRTMTYTPQGQLATETWYAADGVTVVNTLTYTYFDADGTADSGKLKTARNAENGQTYTYSFTYDTSADPNDTNAGQLTGVTEPFGVSLSFSYDTAGNRTLVSDSFDGHTTSTYVAGQLTERTFTQGSQDLLSVSETYNNTGQVQQVQYTDDSLVALVATSAYSYDPSGQISEVKQTGASDNVIADYQEQYNAAGELSSQTTTQGTASPGTENYSYDGQGQLTGAAGAYSDSYSYDLNGNRDMTSAYQIGPNNELISDGVYNYTYDNEGNETSKTKIVGGDKWTYGYDNLNELVQAVETTSAGVQEEKVVYIYDVFGNRIEEQIYNGTATTPTSSQGYAYDGWDPAKPTPVGNENWDVWADLTISATGQVSLATRYLRGDAVDQLFARIDTGSSAAWYLTDNQGSVRNIITSTGTVLDSITYDAFGNIIQQSDTTGTELGRYAWTGREFDSTSGLQYNHARYYDPVQGRWLSQDPMGFDAGDSNLYRYVSNDPTNAIDPSGQYLILDSDAVAAWQNYFSSIGVRTVTVPLADGRVGLVVRAEDLDRLQSLVTQPGANPWMQYVYRALTNWNENGYNLRGTADLTVWSGSTLSLSDAEAIARARTRLLDGANFHNNPTTSESLSFWAGLKAFYEGANDGAAIANRYLTLGLIPYFNNEAARARRNGHGSSLYFWGEGFSSFGVNLLQTVLGIKALGAVGGSGASVSRLGSAGAVSEWHHVWPRYLGLPPNWWQRIMPRLVFIPKPLHDIFTQAIKGAFPYGRYYDERAVADFLRQLYDKYSIGGFPYTQWPWPL